MPVAELLSGTITFLFTDIEGSTTLWERHPEAMRAALIRHDALLTAVIEDHGGVVVKSRGEGDSFFAVFPDAGAGVAAATAVQRALAVESWPTPAPIRVRMSLHTGEADLRDGDYYGPVVNRCARLRAAGHGGQVLLSQATYDRVRGAPPSATEIVDLGERRLKDLVRPERVYQVLIAGLPRDFPPLRTLDARPNNLAVQPTPLIGREAELLTARQRLLEQGARLLTLSGPGGIGKSRLSLQIAADQLDSFEHGAFFVALAPISDPALVASTIAQVLGVRESGDRPLFASLVDHLRDKELLLVLDNFEQVVASAPLVADLLAVGPRLKVLVTSRALLHLRGEKELPVAPLGLPDPRRLPTPDNLAQYPAVALFLQRAADVKPGFGIAADNAAAIAEICVRLDGLPLAIELAASRVRLLPPAALLQRLERRLALLTGGARDLPERQQTLRGAIAWSYELLDAAQQRLFRRLSPFVGGCTFEAAEAVCDPRGMGDGGWGLGDGASATLPSPSPSPQPPSSLGIEVLDGMASLIDQSLLRQEEQADGEPRFLMLETVREYGREVLEASGEAEAIGQAHVDFYLALAEEAEPELTAARQGVWLDRLEGEHDNLRAALRRLTERGDAETGLRLGGALWRFWYGRGYLSEGRERLAGLLALGGAPARTPARAKALNGLGNIAYEQGDYPAARALHQEGLQIARELGDTRLIAILLNNLANLAVRQGDRVGARALYEESLALRRELGDRSGVAASLHNLGNLAYREDDHAAARSLYQESLALKRRLGDKRGIADSLHGLGNVASEQGDAARARPLYEESLEIERELGNKRGIAISLNNLGDLAKEQGDHAEARRLYEESLEIKRELGNKRGIAISLNNLGDIASERGDRAAARALYEESLTIRRELGDKQDIATALASLGDLAFQQDDVPAARAHHSEALAMRRELGNKRGIADSLEAFAALAQAEGDADQAARLLGAAEALRKAVAAPSPPERTAHERALAALRVAVRARPAWAEGRALTATQAVDRALGAAAGV